MPSEASGTTSDHSHPRIVPLNFDFRSRCPNALIRFHSCQKGLAGLTLVFFIYVLTARRLRFGLDRNSLCR